MTPEANQMPDPEIVDRISANQGSTDVDSPTAAATGGVIAIVSDKPHNDFGTEAVISHGSFDEQRYFARVDSGEIGPFGTTMYGTLSYASNDKFKGFGYERKIQGNLKFCCSIDLLNEHLYPKEFRRCLHFFPDVRKP